MADEADQTQGSAEDAAAADAEHPESSKEITRRKFLARASGVAGGLIAAGVGVPAIFYVAGPSAEDSGTEEWIRLGSASSVEPGTETLMKATVERRAGYTTTTEELSVFVSTDDGVDFAALSNVCTHLGCRVRWVEEQQGFFCPCHAAVFAPDGTVVTGPPPRPLDRFETKVEDGQIFIRSL